MASVIFFVRISKITAIIHLNFLELSELYLYLLPKIIIYILPVTFFIAIALALFKMSKDNESIVLFALTLDPRKIAKLFFSLSLLMSLLLFINAIFLMPISEQLYKNFVEYKKMEAKLNIKATEFGQKFSDWLVFINQSDDEDNYEKVVLFNSDQTKAEDTFIIADGAKIYRDKNFVKLDLSQGKAFNIKKDEIYQIDYQGMKINHQTQHKDLRNTSIIEYWLIGLKDKKRTKDLSFHILISIFPLATFLFALALGIVNIRHQKPNIYFYMFVIVLAYYQLTYTLSNHLPFLGIPIVFILFFTIANVLFYQNILKRY